MTVEARNKILMENMSKLEKACKMFVGNFPNSYDYDDLLMYLVEYTITAIDKNENISLSVTTLFYRLINYYKMDNEKKINKVDFLDICYEIETNSQKYEVDYNEIKSHLNYFEKQVFNLYIIEHKGIRDIRNILRKKQYIIQSAIHRINSILSNL